MCVRVCVCVVHVCIFGFLISAAVRKLEDEVEKVEAMKVCNCVCVCVCVVLACRREYASGIMEIFRC